MYRRYVDHTIDIVAMPVTNPKETIVKPKYNRIVPNSGFEFQNRILYTFFQNGKVSFVIVSHLSMVVFNTW